MVSGFLEQQLAPMMIKSKTTNFDTKLREKIPATLRTSIVGRGRCSSSAFLMTWLLAPLEQTQLHWVPQKGFNTLQPFERE